MGKWIVADERTQADDVGSFSCCSYWQRTASGGDHSLAGITSIRAARPEGEPIYVIMDDRSANKTPAVRAWAARHKG